MVYLLRHSTVSEYVSNWMCLYNRVSLKNDWMHLYNKFSTNYIYCVSFTFYVYIQYNVCNAWFVQAAILTPMTLNMHFEMLGDLNYSPSPQKWQPPKKNNQPKKQTKKQTKTTTAPLATHTYIFSVYVFWYLLMTLITYLTMMRFCSVYTICALSFLRSIKWFECMAYSVHAVFAVVNVSTDGLCINYQVAWCITIWTFSQ